MKNSQERRWTEFHRLISKRLQRDAFQLYARALARLLESQREYDFLKPLADALRAKRWPEVYALADSLSAQKYPDATSHFVANQFALLVKKYPWDSKLVELDPKRAAVDSFMKAERRNGRVNRKFSILSNDPSRDVFRTEGKLAMSWIRSVIGSRPPYQAIAQQCDFGQGASIGVHGDATHILRKLSREQEWTVTPGAIHHAFGGMLHNPHYLETLLSSRSNSEGNVTFCYDYDKAFESYVARLSMVEFNKLSFVAKTAKTHRSIATEPLLNGFYQKGIDQVIRGKLLKAGLDLSDQGLNQRLAREGSINDSQDGYVTIDLKNASNSMARGVVKYLYPPDWLTVLDRARSHYLSYEGRTIRYNMLCSMGNGFCFPVQTLTFAAICFACGCGAPGVDFMVYGDDIIVRKRYATYVLAMLKHCGFATNLDKTFLEGPFRESCGTDWFAGEDVRPFTLDFAFDQVENFFKYLNLTQRSDRTSLFFAPIRSLVLESLPIEYRFFRPLKGEVDTGIDSLGDEYLTSPFCSFHPGTASWRWLELIHVPLIDVSRLEKLGHEPWLMGVALRGSKSLTKEYGQLVGLPGVSFRRKTRAKIASNSYSSTSNWLPTPRDSR